jgi:hypothetical protein
MKTERCKISDILNSFHYRYIWIHKTLFVCLCLLISIYVNEWMDMFMITIMMIIIIIIIIITSKLFDMKVISGTH